ncbi:histone-fold-containing protein, partial [Phakopsora pachyrhizi]
SRPIDDTDLDKFNPQHLLLPLSNVSKLMKYSLPADAKVSNQSKLLIQSCVSEFCNFLGSHSNSNVIRNDRKTINGVDLIFSLKELGFDGYHQCLQIYLVKYRNVINELGKRQRKTTSKATTGEVEDL